MALLVRLYSFTLSRRRSKAQRVRGGEGGAGGVEEQSRRVPSGEVSSSRSMCCVAVAVAVAVLSQCLLWCFALLACAPAPHSRLVVMQVALLHATFACIWHVLLYLSAVVFCAFARS